MSDFPQSVLELVQKQLALTGRVGATRVYVTPAITAAAGLDSAPVPIRFTSPGYVLAMYGQESSQATVASYAQTGVRAQINGNEDLHIDGNGGPAFAKMMGLFGGVNNWFPLCRRVLQGDLWIFTFRNGTAGLITPEVELAFFADADIERMAARNSNVRG